MQLKSVVPAGAFWKKGKVRHCMKATPLEMTTLDFFHRKYSKEGFPHPSDVEIVERLNTGSGRRVVLKTPATIKGFSGYLDMQGHFIEMDGLEQGLMATVSVDDGAIDELEFSVYGEHVWDGGEKSWRIV